MSKKFGKILTKLRQQNQLTQADLCKGLCSIPTLSRLEAGLRLPDYLLFDSLLTRLGKDSIRWEVIIKEKDKELLQKRNEMEYLLKIEDVLTLENEIKKYQTLPDFSPHLHLQYSLFMEGNLLYNKKYYEQAIQKYQDALSQTNKQINLEEIELKGRFSRNELRILCFMGIALLEYDKVSNTTIEKYLKCVKQYMDDFCSDKRYGTEYRSIILYCFARLYYLQENYFLSIQYCKEGIDDLIQKRERFYLKDFLVLLNQMQEMGIKEVEEQILFSNFSYFIDILEEWDVKNIVLQGEKPRFSLQHVTTPREIIKYTRKFLGKTQEDIMGTEDGEKMVVDQVSLSLIEHGKREARKDVLRYCFEQLNLSKDSVNDFFYVENENIEMQEQWREIYFYTSIHQKEKARKKLLKLKEKMYQYSVIEQIYIKRLEMLTQEKATCSMEFYRNQIIELLQFTVPNINEMLVEQKELCYYLNMHELHLLLNYAVSYHQEREYQKALQYYKMIEVYSQKYYSMVGGVFYPAILQNLSSVLGLLDCFDQSLEKSHQCLWVESCYSQINKMNRTLFNIAWCYNKKMQLSKKEEDRQYYQYLSDKYAKQSKYLSEIFVDDEIIHLLNKCNLV